MVDAIEMGGMRFALARLQISTQGFRWFSDKIHKTKAPKNPSHRFDSPPDYKK
jgi:hypothetical protein